MTATEEGSSGAVSDAWLKNYLLAGADDKADLREEARLVLPAALEARVDLFEVHGDGTRTEVRLAVGDLSRLAP